jgi:hypothetical protein
MKDGIYKQNVKDCFMDHLDCIGMSEEESEDIFNESHFDHIEKWLIKRGYDLDEYGRELK